MAKVDTKIKYKSLQTRHNDALNQLKNYKLLVDSVRDYAIFLMDAEGYIRTWNKGAQRIKGYAPDEIIGKHFSTFYRPVDLDAEKPRRELEIALKFGRAEDEDWRIRKDGSLFWASVVITALYDNDNHNIGFAKVTRDLTHRKKHEDELRKANKLLRSQQRELRKLNKSKDEFISIASHQLRTPATAIKQLLGMYVDGIIGDLPEQHLEIIKKAYKSNERQINIVNGLIQVAKVDSGEMKLTLTKCNIVELIEECIALLDNDTRSKKQTLTFKPKSTTAKIPVDKQNLGLALENIISNAIKYTHEKGSIEISTSEDDDRLYITVSDNGVGIAHEDIEKLFTKFTRIPNDLSDKEGGTGLGLYWAHRVIALHKGQIKVSSQLNEGTVFQVILPKGG